MSRNSEIDADLAEMHADRSITFAWDGEDYTGTVERPELSFNAETGGFLPTAEFNLRVRRSSLPEELPKHKDLVEIESVSYRIIGVTNDIGSPIVIFSLVRK